MTTFQVLFAFWAMGLLTVLTGMLAVLVVTLWRDR